MTTERIEGGIQSAATPSGTIFSIWCFLALSAAVSWTVWLWPISEQTYLYVSLGPWRVNWPLSNVKDLIGNALPGVIALIWARHEGKRQLEAMLSSLFAWRTKLRWYMLSVALPFAVFAVAMCSVLVVFPEKPRWPHFLVLANTFVAIPFGPLSEEIAWRAFALRRLYSHYSQLTSALIIGVYWGLWHVPAWLLTATYHTAPFLIIYCANLIAWSVIFAFLYDRSGQSLPVTIVLHSASMIVQNLAFASIARGASYISPIAAALSVGLAVIFATRLNDDQPTSLALNHDSSS
jgi:uncharacterized protein